MEFKARSVVDKGGNEFIEVTVKGDDGQESTRTLTISDFLDAMGKSVRHETVMVPIKSGFFPSDYLSLMFGDLEHYSCSFIVEPKKRVFVLSDGGHYHIPYPKLLFQVSRSGYSMEGHVFALKSKGKSKTLYAYPFGNVSTDGRICMGNIDLKELESVTDFTEEFFLGVTNGDYLEYGKARVKPSYTQNQLLEKLEKLDEFPDKWLIESNVPYDRIVRTA